MALAFRKKRNFGEIRKRNPDPTWLDDLLQQGDVFLKPHPLRMLWRYHQLLHKRNKDRDLSRITGFENMVFKELRNQGYIDKVRSTVVNLKSRSLSL